MKYCPHCATLQVLDNNVTNIQDSVIGGNLIINHVNISSDVLNTYDQAVLKPAILRHIGRDANLEESFDVSWLIGKVKQELEQVQSKISREPPQINEKWKNHHLRLLKNALNDVQFLKFGQEYSTKVGDVWDLQAAHYTLVGYDEESGWIFVHRAKMFPIYGEKKGLFGQTKKHIQSYQKEVEGGIFAITIEEFTELYSQAHLILSGDWEKRRMV